MMNGITEVSNELSQIDFRSDMKSSSLVESVEVGEEESIKVINVDDDDASDRSSNTSPNESPNVSRNSSRSTSVSISVDACEDEVNFASLSIPNAYSRSPSLSQLSLTSASPGTVDWESLTNIEMRMVAENESLQLLYARRDFLLVQDDEYDDNESESGFNDGVISLTASDIRDILDKSMGSTSGDISGDHPWKDIPLLKIPDPQSYDSNELLLWSATISDYRKTCVKCPKYTSMMVYSGIPPPLRGEAWKAMSNAHSPTLRSLYKSLAAESTHFAKIIGRDLNRTFPEISLFREKGGLGQVMLGKVMRAYSAYDIQVGYCQGLTFLVGPLLLHMNDCDAFCVMVRLMEDYELRSMFTVNMAGVPMRMYQFEHLFAEILPELHQHFNRLEMSTIYASQWFLSMFAVTCPLSMLVRIYDLIFCEGAISTLMRTALAALKRNQAQLLEFDDEEPILELLLGKCLWEVYNNDADLLVSDITSIDGTAILHGLEVSETAYNSMGKLERARSRKRGKKTLLPPANRTHKDISTPSKNFFSSLTWLTPTSNSATNSTTNLTNTSPSRHSLCSTSTTSSDEETISTLLSPITPPTTSPSQLLLQLELEQKERQVDKDIIETLLAALPPDFIKSNPKLAQPTVQLRQRFLIPDHKKTNSNDITTTCTTCDHLLMDLASSKANEALARQQIDSLEDELMHLKSQFSINRPPSPPPPRATVRHSPSKWNIW